MPADNPQVGETWELYDPTEGRASQAVIVEPDPGRRDLTHTVRLMNRLGRVLTIPSRSFLLTWRYVFEAVTHPCWYASRPQGCERLASLQVNDPSGWVWVCSRHLPAGQQALLPFDRPEDRDNLTASETQCPRCNTAIQFPGSSSEREPDSSVTVQRCGRCGSHWALLLGRGEEDDGVTLCELIHEAAEALHGRALSIRAIVGHAAYASIRRIIRPASHVGGVPVQQGPGVGANNVVVIGDRPTTGVQRLGTSPSTVYTAGVPQDAGAPPEAPVERRPLSPLSPAVGSTWQEVIGGRFVVVTEVREDQIDREVVVFRFGSGEENQDSLGVREFLARFTIHGRPRTPQQENDVVLQAARNPQRALVTGPRAGDTWWQNKTGRPVLVLAVEVDEESRHLVRYKDSGGHVIEARMDGFVTGFAIDPPDPGCAPGEEWTDDTGSVLKIEEVRIGRREIVGRRTNDQKETVPLAIFMTRFRRLIRRSVYERLLDDEDDP